MWNPIIQDVEMLVITKSWGYAKHDTLSHSKFVPLHTEVPHSDLKCNTVNNLATHLQVLRKDLGQINSCLIYLCTK